MQKNPRFSIEFSNELENLVESLTGDSVSKSATIRHLINAVRSYEPNARRTPNDGLNDAFERQIFLEERASLGKRLSEFLPIGEPVKRKKSKRKVTDNPKRIFISYAREDLKEARKVYWKLKRRGHDPWMDDYSLKKGTDWQLEVSKAISRSEFFVAVLSRSSVSKNGFVQVEVHKATEEQLRRPEGVVYLIPFIVESCEIPERFKRINYINRLETRTPYQQLIEAVEAV